MRIDRRRIVVVEPVDTDENSADAAELTVAILRSPPPTQSFTTRGTKSSILNGELRTVSVRAHRAANLGDAGRSARLAMLTRASSLRQVSPASALAAASAASRTVTPVSNKCQRAFTPPKRAAHKLPVLIPMCRVRAAVRPRRRSSRRCAGGGRNRERCSGSSCGSSAASGQYASSASPAKHATSPPVSCTQSTYRRNA